MQSIKSISRKLGFSNTTTHRILRQNLKFKPFKTHRCQELTEEHKTQRLTFCRFILQSNINLQNVVFTDEKWFFLRPHPNKQNTRVWSSSNPFRYDDCVKQGAEKVMCFVAIVAGKILPPIWFPPGTSINSDKYLEILRDLVWPEIQKIPGHQRFYYQQDGAPCHCAKKCLEFLSEKFKGKVISRRSSRPWPAHSPDLSPLDFWFWGEMDEVIRQRQPETLEHLKEIVEEAAEAKSADEVIKATSSVRKRAILCVKNHGGHFEAEC